MINNLEPYNKAQLIEFVKTQIEEYQKLESISNGRANSINEMSHMIAGLQNQVAKLEKERNELNGKNTCLNNQAKSIRHAHTSLVQNDDFEESIFKCYYRVPVEEFNKLTEVILSSKGFGGNQQAKQLREEVTNE